LRLGPDPVAPSIQFYISPDWTHQPGLLVSGIDAERRCPMNQILAAFLAILVFQSWAHAVDKIRIGVPELNPQFPLLALVEREISPSEVADLSILKEMQNELGIKER
jgi:hypothetical protein